MSDAGDRLFHVRIDFRPDDLPADRRDQVMADERVRGRALRDQGHLERIWRVRGGSSSISIWSAPDEARVHELLAALPIAPWSRFDVFELERHPLELEAGST
jgi:muconolactone D-isomerase